MGSPRGVGLGIEPPAAPLVDGDEPRPTPGTMADVPKPELALLPHFTYDELTVLITAIVSQVQADRDVLEEAESPEIAGLVHERVKIGRSLLTAALEARMQTNRPHGGPLEPLRVAWEQEENTTSAWRPREGTSS